MVITFNEAHQGGGGRVLQAHVEPADEFIKGGVLRVREDLLFRDLKRLESFQTLITAHLGQEQRMCSELDGLSFYSFDESI